MGSSLLLRAPCMPNDFLGLTDQTFCILVLGALLDLGAAKSFVGCARNLIHMYLKREHAGPLQQGPVCLQLSTCNSLLKRDLDYIDGQ